jgi:hypothetical protein
MSTDPRIAHWQAVAERRAARKAATIEARRAKGTGYKLPRDVRSELARELAKTLAYEQAGKRAAAKLWGQKLRASIRALFGDSK